MEDLYLGGREETLETLIKLFEVFELKKLNFENRKLKADIKNSIIAIQLLEKKPNKDAKKHSLKEQRYREFDQKSIRRLGSILSKNPLKISAGFEMYYSSRRTDNLELEPIEAFQCIVDDVNKGLERTGLPDVCFCFEPKEGLSLHNQAETRLILSSGIFYYIDRLIRKGFPRPRKCSNTKNCSNWFLARRDNHYYCSPKCKDVAYGETDYGSTKRKLASQRYRDKKKGMLK